ncbi:MAG: alpha/beta hydrolase [Minisyncoccota bacterium]
MFRLLVVMMAGCIQMLAGTLGTAPDTTVSGPNAVVELSYREPATVNSFVLPNEITEIWAQAYYPATMSANTPVVIMMHGFASSCKSDDSNGYFMSSSYTTTGTCPPGTLVGEYHKGFSYIARNLASHGYFVWSINTLRGIGGVSGGPSGDPYFIAARGRMVIEHLRTLRTLNTQQFGGKLDFLNIGFGGHSRGGEGVRAAWAQLQGQYSYIRNEIGPLNVKAIFEIAATDNRDGASTTWTPQSTKWGALLSMCDRDQGNMPTVGVYDRILGDTSVSLKVLVNLWGTNHNFYNEEWIQSDWDFFGSNLGGCTGTGHIELFSQYGGPQKQRRMALAFVSAFFRANVGVNANLDLNQIFDPLYRMPLVVTSGNKVVDRMYRNNSPQSRDIVNVVDFINPVAGSIYTNLNLSYQQVKPNSSPNTTVSRQMAILSGNSGINTLTVYTHNGGPWYQGIDARVGLKSLDINLLRFSGSSPQTPIYIGVELITGYGSQMVNIADYVSVLGPVGNSSWGNYTILKTVRIPLVDFSGSDLSNIQGVRLTFYTTTSEQIALGYINLTP